MTRIIQGSTPVPDGITASTEMSIFRKMTLNTIMRHIEPNIRTQPLKMSSVLLLPPMAKASGDKMVSTAVTTYRSPTSKNRRTTCHMTINPMMMTSSHDAPMEKVVSSGMGICTLEGT